MAYGNREVRLELCGHIIASDVVLETKVLVSRRLEDKNTSLGLGLEIKVLVLILVLTKKS